MGNLVWLEANSPLWIRPAQPGLLYLCTPGLCDYVSAGTLPAFRQAIRALCKPLWENEQAQDKEVIVLHGHRQTQTL